MDIDELLRLLFNHMKHTLVVVEPLSLNYLYPPALWCVTCKERIFDPEWTV